MVDGSGIGRAEWRFFALSLVLIFLAHAVAYLAHEYSHAAVAWALGWARSPVGIDYGRTSLANLLFQQDVGDGVDYAPIFHAGHGVDAALIALAGPGLGNGLVYGLCFLTLHRRWVRGGSWAAMFLFWLALMSAGNVWSYAPMRTITTHGDMALAAHGLERSPWLLLPLVTAPSALILWSFFFRLLPSARRVVAVRGAAAQDFVALMSCYVFFVFFGYAGMDFTYGDTCALLSIASTFVVFPLAMMRCLRARERGMPMPPVA